MINKGIFKELYDESIARCYHQIFKSKNEKDRTKLIVTIIMDKSPSYTEEYKDFQKQDQTSFDEFHKELKIIIEKSYNLSEFDNESNWNVGWNKTWNLMKRDLSGLSQVNHNMMNEIYREKDAQLIRDICQWYLNNMEKHQEMFNRVFNAWRKEAIKLLFEKWDQLRMFKR